MAKASYFEGATSWAVEQSLADARSKRLSWMITAGAIGVAALEAVALAMLAPLKTVQPLTVLVDRQTGYVEAIDPLAPRRISADAALTQSLLAQYVTAREGYDRAVIAGDYRRVGLWSAGRVRSSYLASMAATNPASPLNQYPAGTSLLVQVKSVSKMAPNLAFVRFSVRSQRASGEISADMPYVSTVRYGFDDAPMTLADRLINPLGFQVTGYSRAPEVPEPPRMPLASSGQAATTRMSSSDQAPAQAIPQ